MIAGRAGSERPTTVVGTLGVQLLPDPVDPRRAVAEDQDAEVDPGRTGRHQRRDGHPHQRPHRREHHQCGPHRPTDSHAHPDHVIPVSSRVPVPGGRAGGLTVVPACQERRSEVPLILPRSDHCPTLTGPARNRTCDDRHRARGGDTDMDYGQGSAGWTPTSRRCRAGSAPSAARSATSCTAPTWRSRRPSSAPGSPLSCSTETSAHSWRPGTRSTCSSTTAPSFPSRRTSSPAGTTETARTDEVNEGQQLNAGALAAMFTQIIANNRAGGWRVLKKAPSDPER